MQRLSCNKQLSLVIAGCFLYEVAEEEVRETWSVWQPQQTTAWSEHGEAYCLSLEGALQGRILNSRSSAYSTIVTAVEPLRGEPVWQS